MTYTFNYAKGRGGFARVDIVSDHHGQQFAQKTYDPQAQLLNDVGDAELRRRFVREVQYQSSVNHPNVVQILQSFLMADPPAFIMPVADCTLRDEMAFDPTLGTNLHTALSDILNGLEHLHRSGYVHRDLKPANVLRFTNGTDVRYAISDFGLMSASHSDSSTLTGTNANGGTTNYAAPELIGNFRRATAAADIYAFGAILHDIFGNAAQRIPYTELDGPGEIGAIIQRCTKRLPMRRYPNVSVLRDELYQALNNRPVVFNSTGEERIVDLLRANATLTDAQWDEVFIQIERNTDRNQSTNTIFQALSIDHITALSGNAPELFIAFGSYFSDHINGASFNFDYCDVLASKAELFYNFGDITLKTNIALSLLYLGVSHNRWYVERKAAAMISTSIEDALADRIRVEISVTNYPFASRIQSMERSISFTRESLHPTLRALV
jgi:serine/threonine protein kinase